MRLAWYYAALFGTVGLFLPYFPPYLRSLSLGGKEIALVGSLPYVMMVAVPPVWGFFADRTQRPTRLLAIASAGSALTLVPLLAVVDLWGIVVVMGAHGVFHTTLSSLADTVAVVEARRLGTDYSRLRVLGLGHVRRHELRVRPLPRPGRRAW